MCLAAPAQVYSEKIKLSIDYSRADFSRAMLLQIKAIPLLLGIPANHLRLYKNINGQLRAIPFQIDQKDKSNRYVLSKVPAHKNEARSQRKNLQNNFALDANDELVFMGFDLGSEPYMLAQHKDQLIEIKFLDVKSKRQRWLYIKYNGQAIEALSDVRYVNYDAKTDQFESALYRLGFNAARPFILNLFQLKTAEMKYSENLVDSMRLQHSGKFLHFISFIRNASDYSSVISGIKYGPIRAIRRTKNKVKLFLGLESPEIKMDYIVYNNYFIVDTLIDLPFRVGTFFSDVKTRLSVDWRKQSQTEGMLLSVNHFAEGVLINGKMSQQKKLFSRFNDATLNLQSQLASINITILIPHNLPLEFNDFVEDDMQRLEPLENQPGQWGHIGFITSQWEKLAAGPHSMQFEVSIYPPKISSQARGHANK